MLKTYSLPIYDKCCIMLCVGKPGVVRVEGTIQTTRDFYNALRRWNWKSIACRKREEEPSTDIKGLRKIEGFKELNFDVHGPRHGRMDMGQFLEYLKCHDLCLE